MYEECLEEFAEFFAKHRRFITGEEMEPILNKHLDTAEEQAVFLKFLDTPQGRERLGKMIRDKVLGGEAVKKFEVGQLVMTSGVNDRVADDTEFAKFVYESMARHARGDWGDLGEEDKKENELSLREGFRLLSAYEKPPLPKIWIITEADRSVTTVLFPSEY